LSRTLHFGRTSRDCHVSPSALSRAIQRLERELGVVLFTRDKRNVSLTDDGALFRDYAAGVLDGWSSFEKRLHPTDAPTGTLSIFCTVTAAQSFMPDILERFRASYPGVQIQLETGYAADALAMLKAGTDVAVAALPPRLPNSIAAHTITVTPLAFVAPTAPSDASRAVDHRPVPWGDVPLVVPPFGLAREAVDAWFRRRGHRPFIYSEVASHEGILSLVASGCGVGVVPGLVLDRSSLRDRLRTVAVRPHLGDFHVGACVLRRRLPEPAIGALWATITDSASR
jgi:LysR family positive regulator for ilvC